jgi:hypothetical protein
MQRMTLRLALTSLVACGALALGCGDGGGGTVITPDVPSGDATPDSAADAADDTTDATPTDTPTPDDTPQADASTDAPSVDATPDDAADVTSPSDAPSDTSPIDVPPADVPVMDVPPADVPPADVPPPDVTPMDAGPTGVAGHRATSLVAAGGVMRSPSFRMISTLGQSTIHQTVMRSTGYRLRGGVVGASGGTR